MTYKNAWFISKKGVIFALVILKTIFLP